MTVRTSFFNKARALLSGMQKPDGSSTSGTLPSFPFVHQPSKPPKSWARNNDVVAHAATLGLDALADKARFRCPKQLEQPDLLPDLDSAGLSSAVTTLTERPAREPQGSRRSMENQFLILQKGFTGRPKALFLHALAISYLRRNTYHTAKARDLFFRIWDEHAAWMVKNLNGRWLISALQTFADHGRTPEERRCGSVGFLYGNMIKLYECEIASAYDRRESIRKFRPGAVKDFHEFQPGDDMLLNLNAFVMAAALTGGPAGLALTSLIALVKSAPTVFARTDAMAASKSGAYFSFASRGL